MTRGPTITVEAAQALHQAGKLGEAEKIYVRLLQADPKHVDAWYLYGILALQSGHHGKAVERLQNAARLDPSFAMCFLNLGLAHQGAGQFEKAREALTRAAAIDPKLPEVPNNLGVVLLALGQRSDAMAAFRRAIALRPGYARAHYNLGTALREDGALAEAAAAFAEAARLEPNFVQAHANLGVMLQDLEDRAAAAAAYAHALALNPNEPETLNNLGTLRRGEGLYAEAEALLRKALAARPDFAEARLNLGTVFQAQVRLDEAIAQYRRALALGAKKDAVFYNIALATEFKGDFKGALEGYGEVLRANPDYVEARWNKSLLHLMLREYGEGWGEYECRLSPLRRLRPKRPYTQPRWEGRRDLPGAVLVWGEQGLGDEVLYARMAGELVDAGMDVVCEVEPRLVPLLQRSWPKMRVVPSPSQGKASDPATSAPEIAAQIPMGSLGQFLRPDLAAFPTSASYLRADEARAARYRQQVQARSPPGDFVVGISWSSKNPDIGLHKSIALKDWAPILQTPGISFVDLQYGDTAQERLEAEKVLGVQVQHLPEPDLFRDIDGVAALLAACDLVITVSNTTAHIAGALGVPTWVLLPRGTGKLWYWGTAETTPWYPSARLFRQETAGDWSGVIAAVAEALRASPQTASRRVP